MWVNLKQITKNQLLDIADHCQANHLTVSCAESCTGGGLAYFLTELPGSSAWFKRSVVTYANQSKVDMLDVPQASIDQFGAVSAEVVTAMVNGLAETSDCDIGVAISGIAGPQGGSPHKPVGTVYFGLYMQGVTITNHQVFAGERSQVREQSIMHAIALIADRLSL